MSTTGASYCVADHSVFKPASSHPIHLLHQLGSNRHRICNPLRIQPLTGQQSWTNTVFTRKIILAMEQQCLGRADLKQGIKLAVDFHFAFGIGALCSRWSRQQVEKLLGHDTFLNSHLFNMGQRTAINFAGRQLVQTISYSEGLFTQIPDIQARGTCSSFISLTSSCLEANWRKHEGNMSFRTMSVVLRVWAIITFPLSSCDKASYELIPLFN